MSTVYRSIESLIAISMFAITIVFLSSLAIVIQYVQTESGLERLFYSQQMIKLLFLLWPIFIIERLLAYFIFCSRNDRRYSTLIFILLLPPLRLATRRCTNPAFIWLLGWREVNSSLYLDLEKRFLLPILLFSLVMIPFWITEIFLPQKLHTYPVLYHIVNLGNALIWELFVIEFIIMFSIAAQKLGYLKKHWLELFIIILPMLALARFALLSRYASLGRTGILRPDNLLKIEKIRRILNIYRTRSVINRILRILIIIDIVKRFYQRRHPEKYLSLLQEKLAKREQEIAKLKEQIAETQQIITEIDKKSGPSL